MMVYWLILKSDETLTIPAALCIPLITLRPLQMCDAEVLNYPQCARG